MGLGTFLESNLYNVFKAKIIYKTADILSHETGLSRSFLKSRGERAHVFGFAVKRPYIQPLEATCSPELSC